MSVVINGSAGVTTNSGAVYDGIQSGTAQASTSGTSIDFTGIPSWVKRITVMFSGVSSSSTSNYLVQLGDSGGIENTGYTSAASRLAATAASTATSTAGFNIKSDAASSVNSGSMLITNVNGNTWCANHALGSQATTDTMVGGGSKTLSDTLTQVRITTVNGTYTFDAGSINILYE